MAARPATTFVCQFCPPGSGSGSATLGLTCISTCFAAGGRSLHMLKKVRRNWRWRVFSTLVCHIFPPGSESGSPTLGLTCISTCVAAGGRSLHMLKKARRTVTGGGGPPSHYFCVSILPSWIRIRIRIRNTGPYLNFYFCLQLGAGPAHAEESAA